MLAVAIYVAVPSLVFAQAQKETTLTIAVRQHLPPYVGPDASTGIEIDLIKAIFEDSQYKVRFVPQPRVRMIAAFDSNRVDGILTQNINASSKGCATDWYIYHQNVAKTLAERQLPLDSLEDLKNYAVLSFSGATRYIGNAFDQAVKRSRLYVESVNEGNLISLLYNKRFDVAIGDRWVLSLAHRRHIEQTGEYKELTTHVVLPPTYYIARFNDQEVCDTFNMSLDRLRKNGRFEEIWEGYRSLLLPSDSISASNQP